MDGSSASQDDGGPSQDDGGPSHVFVLLAGFLGSSRDVAVIGQQIRQRFGRAALLFTPRSFSGHATLSGIDVCAAHVLAELQPLCAAHASLRAISLVSYSMGGLVARYLAGLLQLRAFLGLTPLNLVTLACPHLGMPVADEPASSARLLPLLSRFFGGRTGSQIALTDRLCLLRLMAHPRSVFAAGLAAFERRALYANAESDRAVSFASAFIAAWHDGVPARPPRPASPEPPRRPQRHRHVEWSGVVVGGEDAVAAGQEEGPPPGSDGAPRVLPDRVGFDALSLRQKALLCALGACALPLSLPASAVTLPLLLLLALAKRCAGYLTPPPPRELLRLRASDGEAAGGGAADCSAGVGRASRPSQSAMAAHLNSLCWHKASVRFSVHTDGILALSTHAHIVVCSPVINGVGLDVLEHVVATMVDSRGGERKAGIL